MGYVQIVGPTVEPLDLASTKLHCRVDHGDDDTLITSLITAARIKFERDTSQLLLQQRWRLSLDYYPLDPIRTAFGPVQSIDSLKFTNTDMTVTTVDPSQYLTDVTGLVARTYPALFQPWPWVYWAGVRWGPHGRHLLPGAVQMEFTAGYGVDATFVPQLIKQALLLIVGHWYSNREAVLGGEGRFMALEMPVALQDIIDSYEIDTLG